MGDAGVAMPSNRHRKAGLTTIVLGGAAVLTLVLGYLTLFSTFAPYDDEGYFLISIKGYLGGATLYNDIYAPYGPFFFELMAGAFKVLGLPVTNDSGRLITLVLWFAAAVLVGLATYRLARSLVVGAVAALLAFRVASTSPNEPMHPGHLLMFLLAGTVATAALSVDRRPRLGFILIGALGAMALLSKANVGALMLAAAAFACVIASPRLVRLRPLSYAIAAAFVVTPIIVMSKNVVYAGYTLFALHLVVCALAVAFVAFPFSRSTHDDDGAAWWPVWAAGGALALTVVAVGIVLAQGTTISALVQNVVLDAFHQTDLFASPVHLPSSTIAWDAVSLAVAAAVARIGLPSDDRWRAVAGLVRLAVGVWIWIDVIGPNPLGMPATLAWVAAVPVSRELTPAARFVRVFLPALAVLQALHAYPVPGSQVTWGAFALVPIGAVCVGDGLAELNLAAISRRWLALAAGPAALGLTVWAVLTTLVFPLQTARATYRAGVSLAEPGAAWIRVPASTEATYQWLTTEIKSNCSTFVSSPGFGSLYLMTGETPPTWLNLSGWPVGFGAATQTKALNQVQGAARLCAVRNTDLEAFWAQSHPIPQLPLYEFIVDDFRTIGSEGGFDVSVRKSG